MTTDTQGRDTSCVFAPIRDHAFFKQPVLKGQISNALLQGTRFTAQVLHFTTGRCTGSITRQTPLASFHFCHGIGTIGGGVVQDLRKSVVLQDADGWRATLHGGRLEEGMPDFSDFIDDKDAEAIRAYVATKAELLYLQQEKSKKSPPASK